MPEDNVQQEVQKAVAREKDRGRIGVLEVNQGAIREKLAAQTAEITALKSAINDLHIKNERLQVEASYQKSFGGKWINAVIAIIAAVSITALTKLLDI